MTGLLVNMIGGLFLVAALGILGLVLYNSVANAYRETVLAEAEGKDAKTPKHRRYSHFLWRLVYPFFALVGICLKVMAVILGDNPKNEEETRWHDGVYWKRSSAGTWYSYGADEDDYPPPL